MEAVSLLHSCDVIHILRNVCTVDLNHTAFKIMLFHNKAANVSWNLMIKCKVLLFVECINIIVFNNNNFNKAYRFVLIVSKGSMARPLKYVWY